MLKSINLPKELQNALDKLGVQVITKKTNEREINQETKYITRQLDADGNQMKDEKGKPIINERVKVDKVTVFDEIEEEHKTGTVTISYTVKDGEIIDGWASVVDHSIKGAEGVTRVDLV